MSGSHAGALLFCLVLRGVKPGPFVFLNTPSFVQLLEHLNCTVNMREVTCNVHYKDEKLISRRGPICQLLSSGDGGIS
jgi:hypothetical protein